MKKLSAFLLVLTLTAGILVQTAKAQITVSGSNTKDGTYTSLTKVDGAFAALSSISQATKTIIITITANVTDEDGATALTGVAGMWTSLIISPSGARTISGSVSKPLIDLNGADNVTIDGLNTGGNSLVISNLSTATTAGTSTIRFINDASGNTVQYCTIKGSTKDAAAGIIFFSTTTGSTGNDGNYIDNNNITNSVDANRPLNAIYSLGITGSNLENSGNFIRNNNIYDFMNKTAASNGINLGSFTTAWTISGNSFYETASFAATTGAERYPIYISTAGISFTISGNYIGGSSAECLGTWTKTATDGGFRAMNISVGTGTASNIQGNTIKNISWTNTGVSLWCGIFINAGDVNIGTTLGNVIGAAEGNGSITFTGGGSSSVSYGIRNAGTGTADIQNNTIGSITTNNSTSTYPSDFYAIYKDAKVGATTISNNQIGSTVTAASINASSLSTANAQIVMGIQNNGTGTITISGNTVANMTNANTFNGSGAIDGIYSGDGTNTITNNTVRDLTIANLSTGNYERAAVIGIYCHYGTGATTITGNTINNLKNTNTSFAGNIFGIYYFGSATASTVSENFIHSLSVTGASSTSASICGIKIYSGGTTYSNNIIRLGGTTSTTLYGIYETGTSGASNLYFNTVYIDGTVASGSNKSYALYSAVNTTTRRFRNNIFNNVRSTSGGASLHYGMYIVATGSITCDYNDYLVSSASNGGMLGYYSGDKSTSVIVTGQDSHSLNTDPLFANATAGTTASDFVPAASLTGWYGTGITTDYAGITRSATPTMGAYESSPALTWTGTTSTAWSTAGNWSTSAVPTASDNVTIPDVTNDPVAASGVGASCNNLTVNSGASLTVQSGGSLITNGSITNNGTINIQRSVTTGSWHLVSAPTTNATANSFVSGDYLQSWSESTGAWTDISDMSTALNPVQGYGLYNSSASARTYTFSGTPNTGNQSKAISYTNGPTGYDGANLLGNPYPSSIDWDGLRTTYGAVYYWNGSAYVSWNNGGSGVQYIPPMQGFFVITATNTTFSLTNLNRTHSGATSYYKSTENQSMNNGIVLYASNGNYHDELYVAIRNEAQEGFELQHDAWKLQSNTSGLSQLWSVCPDGNLSIDLRPETDVIQLGFANDVSGTYTIGLKEFNGISKAQIEDTKTGLRHDLLTGSYSFGWEANEEANRFKLLFNAVGIDEQASISFSAYTIEKTIYVSNPENRNLEVKVIDLMGRTVLIQQTGTNSLISLPTQLKSGVYIIQLTDSKQSTNKKLVIR